MAFESVFSPTRPVHDPERVVPAHLDVSKYSVAWINLATLFRNLVTSVPKEVFEHASVSELVYALQEEIEVITQLFDVDTGGQCKPIFFYSTYEKLYKRNIIGLEFRLPKTANQLFYNGRENATLIELGKLTDTIRVFHDSVTPDGYEKAFMLTHHPYDLVNHRKFDELVLLESNTGAVKTKAFWNTKYNPMAGKVFSHLPFHRKLLLVFGDKVMIKPMPASVREDILKTSEKRHWTPATTEDKILLDLGLDLLDPLTLKTIRDL